ncbi:MAG: YceI family protein [Reyranellales bacterium]
MSETRRVFLLGGAATLLLPWCASAAEQLHIGAARGSIDFSIGDSKIFRTTGSFKEWQGTVLVDDADAARSTVQVNVNTSSIQMMDAQQSEMLKDTDFFDVAKFPKMTYVSSTITRTGDSTLKVEGAVTLRGITRPMELAVSVTDRKPDAAAGARYARFRAEGVLKRSEFGMVKYIDVVGDTVDFSIRTDAWR